VAVRYSENVSVRSKFFFHLFSSVWPLSWIRRVELEQESKQAREPSTRCTYERTIFISPGARSEEQGAIVYRHSRGRYPEAIKGAKVLILRLMSTCVAFCFELDGIGRVLF